MLMLNAKDKPSAGLHWLEGEADLYKWGRYANDTHRINGVVQLQLKKLQTDGGEAVVTH